MKLTTSKPRRTGMAQACFFTAIVNGLFSSAHGQDATRPGLPPPAGASPSLLHYGVFDVLPNLRGGATYDDNIYISSTNRQSDAILSVAPGVLLGAGDYRAKEESLVSIAYSPNFILYTDHTRNNAIDQDAALNAQWRPASWTFGLRQTYLHYSGAVVDVGGRVNRSIYDTAAQVKYDLSPKTTVGIEGQQSINDYSRVLSFNEWQVGSYLDYWLTPKIKVGAGLNAGFLDVQSGPNQTYQQGLVRATYSWSEKLDARGAAGAEVREFESAEKDQMTGVFAIGGTYKPLENTSLSLDAYRRNVNSAVLVSQNYTLTGISGGVRQLFQEKYTLGLSGGYDNLKYTSTDPTAPPATRKDDYYYVKLSAEWQVAPRLVVQAFYQYRKNHSTFANFTFDNNQTGVNFSYAF